MVGATAFAGAAGLAWSAGVEVRWFVLRRCTVPVLPAGHPPLKVLHVSDLHLTPGQARKRRWVQGLAELEPDLVVNTGDNLAHQRSVPAVVEALGALLEVVIVPGGHTVLWDALDETVAAVAEFLGR